VTANAEFADNLIRSKQRGTTYLREVTIARPGCDATLPVPPPQGGRERCGTDLRKSDVTARGMAEPLLPHHINQYSIGISEPMLPHGAAAREHLVERRALLAGVHGGRRKPRIVGRDALDVGLEGLDALDLEADVVHASRDDACVLIVGDVPGHDDQ